mmetsp:Transcript_23507/g.43298  ORF Transcript_23507/g.43298 Transcript_23507/m.43298 type:complete len:230 (+) Transcript_23507:50-739(+)
MKLTIGVALCLVACSHALLFHEPPTRDPAEYEEAYDHLYDNVGYHSSPKFTLERGSVNKLVNFRKSATPKPHTVIVLGCSHGLGVELLHNNSFDAYGVDVANLPIEKALSIRGHTCSSPPCFKQASLTSIPFPDQNFDAGLSADVLEHIAPNDVDTVVSEISRVVKNVLVLRIASVAEIVGNGEAAGMRNLHLTTEKAPFWTAKFAAKGWTVQEDTSDDKTVQLILVRV